MMVQRGMRVVVGLLVAVAAEAGADVLCKTSTGDVKIRATACKSGETKVDPVALGLQGPPGPTGPTGVGVPGPALVMRDANGALVGVVSATNGEVAARSIGGRVVSMPVSETGFRESPPQLYYASTDCTGTPLLITRTLLPPAWVHGSTLLYPAGTPQRFPVGSSSAALAALPAWLACASDPLNPSRFLPPDRCCYLAPPCATRDDCANLGTDDFTCTDGYCISHQYDALAPVVSLDLSTLGLVPPFHIEGP